MGVKITEIEEIQLPELSRILLLLLLLEVVLLEERHCWAEREGERKIGGDGVYWSEKAIEAETGILCFSPSKLLV